MAITNDGPQKIQAIFEDRGAHLQPAEARFIDALLGRERLVTREQLIEAMWGDDEDGGPLSADNVIAVYRCRCNRQIKKAGLPWYVETEPSRGVRLRYTWLTAPVKTHFPPPRKTTYNRTQAAAYLGLSHHCLINLHKRGRGPAFKKLERGYEYRRAVLDAWKARQEDNARMAA